MSKELNCMNCCIGDFKHNLCDCDNGMCKEYKKVGRAEDFENEVMNRTNPKTGKCEQCTYWDKLDYEAPRQGWCNQFEEWTDADEYCSRCEKMRGGEERCVI